MRVWSLAREYRVGTRESALTRHCSALRHGDNTISPCKLHQVQRALHKLPYAGNFHGSIAPTTNTQDPHG